MLAAVAINASGCMTALNFNFNPTKNSQPEWHGGVPQYYGGVRFYLHDFFPDSREERPFRPVEGSAWYESLVGALVGVAIIAIDFPLTVIADTVTLPRVYAAQREDAARRAEPAPIEAIWAPGPGTHASGSPTRTARSP